MAELRIDEADEMIALNKVPTLIELTQSSSSSLSELSLTALVNILASGNKAVWSQIDDKFISDTLHLSTSHKS